MTQGFRRCLGLVLFGLVTLAAVSPAAAKRVALVIGNASYQVGPLANPVNDAEAVAAVLNRLGFDKVDVRRNLDAQGLKMALRDFGADVTGADIALVYFAGHGTENNGTNYLIPVDARLARAADLDLESVRLETVVGALEGAQKLKLVILDACRNNIFPLAGGKRSQARGLARVEPEDNTLIAFSAKEGSTADDGGGATHSPYTTALLKHMETPGLEVDYIFRLVRDDVLTATGRQQMPHLYGTLGRQRIYLAPSGAPDQPTPTAVPAPNAELERLRAEIEELRRKQDAAAPTTQQAALPPATTPAPQEPSTPPPSGLGGLSERQLAATVSRENPQQLYERAFSFLLQNDFQAAEVAFSAFVVGFPANQLTPNALYGLGAAQFEQKKFSDAAQAFETLVQQHRDSTKAPEALLKLGMALAQQGKKSAACTALISIAENYPTAPSNVIKKTDIEKRRYNCR